MAILLAIFDTASLDSWGKLIVVVGIPSVCTLIFVLVGVRRSEKNAEESRVREERMSTRINQLEDTYRQDYVSIIRENQKLFANVVETLQDVHASVEKNTAITQAVLTRLGASGGS